MTTPTPLPAGTVLVGRYELGEVLGRGGFGTTYLARDLQRDDACVVKELSPAGATRTGDGALLLDDDPATARRLRHEFLREGNLISRLRVPGVVPCRNAFQDRGTAFVVMDYVPESTTLERIIQREGRMDADAALDVFVQLLDTLERLHARGILHRDIKPTNVLVTKAGEAFLIDFGSARAWQADAYERHTVLFTPGYAPLEQMSERARRGPATDLYGVCATAYAMLSGSAPPSAPERAAGTPMAGLRPLRSDIEPSVCAAIESGLALKFEQRPQTAAEMKEMLAVAESSNPESDLEAAERRLEALARFRFERRQCPACGDVLEAPRPLAPRTCPVCRQGRIQRRKLSERQCPACRTGTLHRVDNSGTLAYCPACHFGRLRKRGMLGRTWACEDCGARLDVRNGQVLVGDEPPTTWEELRSRSGRAVSGVECDACRAQFDDMPDGRRRQVRPEVEQGAPDVLDPLEWSLVAAGLDPGAGNAACDVCDADFFVDDRDLTTLLGAAQDPFGFAESHAGRPLSVDAMRWMAVGKASGNAGLTCAACGTEFDGEPGRAGDTPLRLAHTHQRTLAGHIDEEETLENWHRLAAGLPRVGEESILEDRFLAAAERAYRQGRLALDPKRPHEFWRGPATQWAWRGEAWIEVGRGTFVATPDEVTFGRLLGRQRIPLGDVLEVGRHEDTVAIACAEQHLFFVPEPLVVSLSVGRKEFVLTLTVDDLVARLAASRPAAGSLAPR